MKSPEEIQNERANLYKQRDILLVSVEKLGVDTICTTYLLLTMQQVISLGSSDYDLGLEPASEDDEKKFEENPNGVAMFKIMGYYKEVVRYIDEVYLKFYLKIKGRGSKDANRNTLLERIYPGTISYEKWILNTLIEHEKY